MHTRSHPRRTVVLAALACLACAPAAHAQVTLDFENLSNPNLSSPGNAFNYQGHSVTQNGFTVTDTSNSTGLASVAPNNINPGVLYTGSITLFNSVINGITTLTQNNGNPFAFNSIDIANLNPQYSNLGGATVTFTGTKQGGGTVTQTFTHGLNNSLETVTFSSFTNLLSVSFVQAYPFNQFDNIRVTPAAIVVPEPGSLALLAGMGIGGAGFLVRRKRRAAC